MTHFGFIKSRAVSLFSRTASRERRLENTRKSLARKILDRFVLEKMEDRWLPTVTALPLGSNGIFIQMTADNDEVYLTRTGGSGSDNITINSTSGALGSFSNITGIIVQDFGVTPRTGQQLVFQSGSVGNFVSTVSSCSIEVINVSSRIDGSITVTGSAAQLEGSVSGSRAASISLNSSSLSVVAPQLSIGSLTATSSTLTLTSALQSGTSISAVNSCISISGIIAPDFSQTSITANGGTFSVINTPSLIRL